MSRTVEARVTGYDGPRYGPRSLCRWTIVYQEPGGSVIELAGQKAMGTRYPDVIDIDREASVGEDAIGILTDDGKLTWFVDPVPHLGPCPGDNGGGGGGIPPGGTILPPGVIGPFIPLPPNEGGGGVMGGGGGPVSGGGGEA